MIAISATILLIIIGSIGAYQFALGEADIKLDLMGAAAVLASMFLMFAIYDLTTRPNIAGQIQALTGKATIELRANERGEMVWTEKATTREGK